MNGLSVNLYANLYGGDANSDYIPPVVTNVLFGVDQVKFGDDTVIFD
jgi:hypothetical protein